VSPPRTSPGAANNGHRGAERSSAGRRSLFAFYPDDDQADDPATIERWSRPGGGRAALFSGPRRRKGTVTVECSQCGARTPLWPPRLVTYMVPSVWVPGLSLRWWMRCPACHDRCVCHLDKSSLLGVG
jgi:hypothetical protein